MAAPTRWSLSLCDAVGMWDEQEVSTQVTHVAPTLGSVAVTGATYVGDTGTLTGTISEPNPLYNYTLQVGWGDGSTETYTLPTGATTFSESYQFQGESSDVDVTLMDDHGDTVTADAPVSINYLLGSLANLQVPAAPEGGTSTLSGNIVNARATDTLSVEVDWGDGSDPQTIACAAGSTSFEGQHQYVDTSPSGGYTVSVTLIDNGEAADSETTTAAVTDVPPTVTSMQVSASQAGEAATLNGTFTDPGTEDTFQLQVTWGDGQFDSEQLGEGVTTFSMDHVYGDEGSYGAASYDHGQRRRARHGGGDGPGFGELAAVAGRIDDSLDQRGGIRGGQRDDRGRGMERLPSTHRYVGRRYDFHLRLRGRHRGIRGDPPLSRQPGRRPLGPVRRGPHAFR